ncbi:ring-cleaving dioxygenase [Synoicihabitans lomoniglobus]|uniref:Ring-cleaving dioxygenase n=1 Tax=Synoicihabitans lomoniglobus TaxID=2909285 RepID=A0AAF0CPH7_9BACT|nr:ring-cleaving dioxygenase [Opitutaceae bacterium LMO-M01]WED64804.1 ring-cleaving dioxygenase [Opitutaceae bacterium LMO-M01]
MQLTGIHHLTAVTANAAANHAFYTQVLGLRLVKKTVNQDDVSAYHLFYADGVASPGSDLTFFDWPVGPERRGAHSVSHTGLRVGSTASLAWWKSHLDSQDLTVGEVHERDGRTTLDFEDPEGQRFALVVDDGGAPDHPWEKSPVPTAHQIRGLGPITLCVPTLERSLPVLTTVMGLREERTYAIPGMGEDAAPITVHVFAMGAGGPAAELHVAVDPSAPTHRQGAGGVHHVAFRTPNFDEYANWHKKLVDSGYPNSGPIDRFYFRSLYFREPNGILFEIATDGPGFAADEPMETLGESLALPPFLEKRRAEIEAELKPL